MEIFGLSQIEPGLVLLLVMFLLCMALAGLYQLKMPSPVDKSAPADQFSSGRALLHLKVISRQPHPLGSSEHRAVGNYLIEQLRSLGLEPWVQETSVIN